MKEVEYKFFKQPEPVGYWILDPGDWILDPGGVVHTRFAMYIKPTDEQIKNTEQMFGWKWKDEEWTHLEEALKGKS